MSRFELVGAAAHAGKGGAGCRPRGRGDPHRHVDTAFTPVQPLPTAASLIDVNLM
jgi:hypothetical protein